MAIKKYKKQDLISYTLGLTLTIELLKTKPELVEIVYLHSALLPETGATLIRSLAQKHGILLEIKDKVFSILADKENCFALGVFKKYPTCLDFRSPQLVLVNPGNAGNLGTIIRTAVGFGFNNLAIIQPAVDIFDPKVVRSSMGALFHLNFQYYPSFDAYRQAASGYAFFTFMLNGKTPLPEITPPKRFALIFGNEGTGLADEFAGYGESVYIPQRPLIDSFNLPIAVGIALYEVTNKLTIKKGHNQFFIGPDENDTYAKIVFSINEDGNIIAHHTLVAPSLRGQGIARQLLDALVAYARNEKLKIIPACSYVEHVFDLEPGFSDIRG